MSKLQPLITKLVRGYHYTPTKRPNLILTIMRFPTAQDLGLS